MYNNIVLSLILNQLSEALTSPNSSSSTGDQADPRAWAGERAAGADVGLQAHAAAAPEAADRPGEQAEGRDGRAPAQAAEGGGDAGQQRLHRAGEAGQAPRRAEREGGGLCLRVVGGYCTWADAQVQ